MSDTSVANELRGLVDNATQQRRSYAGNTSEHTTTTRETKPLENDQTSSQNQDVFRLLGNSGRLVLR